MYIARVSDGDMLFRKAVQTRGTVNVTMAHAVVPGPRGVRRPALLIQYSLPLADEMTWNFTEVRDADATTHQVDLRGTLLDRLHSSGVPYIVNDNGGAL